MTMTMAMTYTAIIESASAGNDARGANATGVCLERAIDDDDDDDNDAVDFDIDDDDGDDDASWSNARCRGGVYVAQNSAV
jgi:hypothetical protein